LQNYNDRVPPFNSLFTLACRTTRVCDPKMRESTWLGSVRRCWFLLALRSLHQAESPSPKFKIFSEVQRSSEEQAFGVQHFA
jgi:hypothetical protein